MTDLKQLLRSHAFHVAEKHNWYCSGENGGIPSLMAWLRAEQLFRLDMLLVKHRRSIADLWQQLPGETAFDHFIFTKTLWLPSQIELLSFSEKLWIVQKDLADLRTPEVVVRSIPDVIQEETRQLLRGQSESYMLSQIQLPSCLREEWDHSLAMKVQDWSNL